MRVIIKPIGLFLVLAAFATLSWIIVVQSQKIKSREEEGATPVPKESPQETTGGTLRNTGFEQDYRPVVAYDNKGQVSGTTATPWYDDSSWAPISVSYEEDIQNPHGGKATQKVIVHSVAADKDARVQFVQSLTLDSKKRYRASCWLRADQPVDIDVALRQKVWPFHYYGVHKVHLDTTWTKQEVTGIPADGGETLFMLKISKPVTFWVDDAALVAE